MNSSGVSYRFWSMKPTAAEPRENALPLAPVLSRVPRKVYEPLAGIPPNLSISKRPLERYTEAWTGQPGCGGAAQETDGCAVARACVSLTKWGVQRRTSRIVAVRLVQCLRLSCQRVASDRSN